LKRILDVCGLRRTVRYDWILVNPCASSYRRAPYRPNSCSTLDSSRLRSSPTVLIPSFAYFSLLTFPIPGSRPTGSGSKNASTSPGRITKSPSGFVQSDASFARNLFGATSAEAVRFNSFRTRSRMVRATIVAVGKPVLFVVTSRYTSSSDNGSIGSVWRLKISGTSRDTARYLVKTGAMKIASGHRRSACFAGIADRTSKALA